MDYTFGLDDIWQLGEQPILDLDFHQQSCPSLDFSEESSTSFEDYPVLSDEHALQLIGLEPLVPLGQLDYNKQDLIAQPQFRAGSHSTILDPLASSLDAAPPGIANGHGNGPGHGHAFPHAAAGHAAATHIMQPAIRPPQQAPPQRFPPAHHVQPQHDWSPHRRSISKMPLAQLYHIMGLPHDHNRARDREERIMRMLSDSGFEIGHKTWIRDTEESFRRKVIDKIWQTTREEYGYNKPLLEAIVRRGTYARMQSNLRRRRRHMIRASRRNI